MQQSPSVIGVIEDVTDDRYEEFCRVHIQGRAYYAHRYLVNGDPDKLKGKNVRLIADNVGKLIEVLLFDEKNGSKELYRHSPEMIEKYEFITMDNAAVTEKSLGDKEASYQAAKFVRRNGRSLRYRELERKTSQRVKLGLGVERRLLEETDYTNAPAYTFEEIEALEWIDMVRETADNCWDVPLNDLYRNKLVQENYYKHAQLARKLPLCVSKMKDRSFDTFVELVKEEMG